MTYLPLDQEENKKGNPTFDIMEKYADSQYSDATHESVGDTKALQDKGEKIDIPWTRKSIEFDSPGLSTAFTHSLQRKKTVA